MLAQYFAGDNILLSSFHETDLEHSGTKQLFQINYFLKCEPEYPVFTPLYFNNKKVRKYLKKGFSVTEKWGTWTDGEEAIIKFYFRKKYNKVDSKLFLKVSAFIGGNKTEQKAVIKLNECYITEINISERGEHEFLIDIKKDYLRDKNKLAFNFINLVSPFEMGCSGDKRKLGFGFHLLDIRL